VLTGVALLIALYFVVWGVSGAQDINITDFDAFFLPSARIALGGHPLEIYRLRYQIHYPNANGPLSMVPLTALAWIVQRLGWLDDPVRRRMLIMAAFAVFPLLLGREALLAADRLLGMPLRGIRRLGAFALIIFSPELWHSVLLYGHLEQPLMLWLVLASVRALTERRHGRAGLYIGLALLTRSMAVLYLLPLALLLLQHRRWRGLLRFGGIAVAVAVLGLLPFWLGDRADLLYSLVTFRGSLPVSGGSLWGLALHTPLEAFAKQYDSVVIISAALVVCVAALFLRRDLDVTSPDVYALLALSGLCFPLFIKTLWPYYFLDAYILLAVWWLAGAYAPRTVLERVLWWLALLLPLSLIGLGQIGESGVTSTEYGTWRIQWSAAMTGAILAVILAICCWLFLLHTRWRALAARLADDAPTPAPAQYPPQ
jgi:hypothetical protein